METRQKYECDRGILLAIQIGSWYKEIAMKSYKKQLSIVRERIATTWEKSKPMVVKGATIAGIGTFIVVMHKLFQSPDDNLGNWLETASDKELDDEYERRRLECHGDVTYEMDRINDEMVRRMNEKYEKEQPNAEPRHREHGWYLPNDD